MSQLNLVVRLTTSVLGPPYRELWTQKRKIRVNKCGTNSFARGYAQSSLTLAESQIYLPTYTNENYNYVRLRSE